jgi:hypothetical protein
VSGRNKQSLTHGCPQQTGEEHSVWQYSCTAWPESPLPRDTDAVLTLRQDMSEKRELLEKAGPVVVHGWFVYYHHLFLEVQNHFLVFFTAA